MADLYYEENIGNYILEKPEEYYKFNYELDHFQLHGCNAINNNHNILITAHTGSGKTALALHGIGRALSLGKKVIYTSPIKSLSNQKYAEFKKVIESLNNNYTIGIMTGDIKINPLGDVLIMTAEILRNALLRESNEIYEWNFNPNEIGCVILDEVHFINNPERGKVWEEIIINLKPDIQLIMLSATISGAEQMTRWIGNLKKIKCHLISTLKRPVPLQHGIWWDKEIHYFLYGDKDWKFYIWSNLSKKINTYYKLNQFSLNKFFECIKYLFDNNMTPANIFLLNRSLIEQYAKKIPYTFTTSEEACKIENIFNTQLFKYKYLYEKTIEWNDIKSLIVKGIGIHHSGMIPILKEIVEILYEQGLIKILLTTETFALGVNMPTKTVVFSQLTKFDGNNSRRNLRPEEYGQMAGRAGRRGKDVIGHVIILPTPYFLSEEEAKTMILSSPQVIKSKLSIDMIFILKQLSINNNDFNFKEKCLNSLFNYQDSQDNNLLHKEYESLMENIDLLNLNLLHKELYYKLYEINNKLKPNGYIKLTNSVQKKLIQEKNELIKILNNKDINIIEKFINYNNDLNIIKLKLDQNNINDQITILINYLLEFNYIDENYNLTKIGKLISEINECNPFLISYIINNNYFENLEFNEIVAICSIFINENKESEKKYILDLNCSNNCKDILYKIEDSLNYFYNLEDTLNKTLPYPIWQDWNINYSMFNLVLEWSNNKDVTIDTFYGNFIKTILRVTNLLKNIEIIAKNNDDIYLLNKINGYQEKLIRGIVTTDSLYL